MSRRYLVAGAGIAGLSAAEAIRECDSEAAITVVSKENNLPYSRPMLTKTPFVSFDPACWTIHDPAWFAENRIALYTGESIEAIDMESHTASGRKGVYGFDKLILATGSSNFIPPFAGRDKKQVFTIREAKDIYAIKRCCAAGSRAVIIGGGVIGLEAALELIRYGVDVTVLVAGPYLMIRQIDEEISDRIKALLSGRAEIVTGASIAGIEGGQKAAAVVLADGRAFPCDFVIIACGTRSNVALAQGIGAEIGRAIKIDSRGRTSVPDVYACGDCAEYQGRSYALWSQGMVQGRAAGINAAGREAWFSGIDTTLLIHSPFMSLCAIGDLGKAPDKTYEVKYLQSEDMEHSFSVNPRQAAFFEKQYWADGRLTGTGIIGNLANMQARKEEILGETGISYVEAIC